MAVFVVQYTYVFTYTSNLIDKYAIYMLNSNIRQK